MTPLKSLLMGSAVALLSSAVCADPLEVEYASFYSHLRKLDNEDLTALQFSFGFKHVGTSTLCHIENALVHTDKQDIPLVVTPEQRFHLPYEKALKLAQATVRIELTEPSNQCDMSVLLETKPEYLKTHYQSEELTLLLDQYRAFFDDMGGFLSFMMPDAVGLKFWFDGEVSTSLTNVTVTDGTLTLPEQIIAQGEAIEFGTLPKRITAITDGE
ncbi:DUF2987 domain-containing protein [Aestuariibacter halophilus]|uniref:DUF2987 domain-containing protein n=1 Tax=Fluctibacter halophilus TaxID=226011 RepID=A0ABS8G5A8_9ALTE|nr:DUF2987 domain-containing protein [Aestuariibacter halophilus]MCC2615715.1 DUF2987 domain-containing protein [Aestuariibacter halophilus]